MEWVSFFYPKAKEHLLSEVPDYWLDLKEITHAYLDDGAFPGEVVLTLCSCKAAGGEPEVTVEVCAGLMSMIISIRILNDLRDRKKNDALHNKIGLERAMNFANAFKTIGYQIFGKLPVTAEIRKEIFQIFYESSLISLAGQDREIIGLDKTWDDYWHTAEMKASFISSATAGIGAIVSTNGRDLIQACQTYGYHWGLVAKIMNDINGVWGENDNADLKEGKITLPVLYGIYCNHPEREQLLLITRNNQISKQYEKVRSILENIDAQNFLIWTALEQREKAIDSISTCPNNEGKDALKFYLDKIFGNRESLLKTNPPRKLSMVGDGSNDHIVFNYKSIGLKLRRIFQYI
jgi:geranylgeranyl pyrophosphate synthase